MTFRLKHHLQVLMLLISILKYDLQVKTSPSRADALDKLWWKQTLQQKRLEIEPCTLFSSFKKNKTCRQLCSIYHQGKLNSLDNERLTTSVGSFFARQSLGKTFRTFQGEKKSRKANSILTVTKLNIATHPKQGERKRNRELEGIHKLFKLT